MAYSQSQQQLRNNLPLVTSISAIVGTNDLNQLLNNSTHFSNGLQYQALAYQRWSVNNRRTTVYDSVRPSSIQYLDLIHIHQVPSRVINRVSVNIDHHTVSLNNTTNNKSSGGGPLNIDSPPSHIKVCSASNALLPNTIGQQVFLYPAKFNSL